ncbi:lysylphosphatidylglycerol synthase transmembrane domain-containing protein [Humibacillus sp. DSM 29435]|uniref:lysylphosphatidylglycerol synthase transmembrane domain-containing protein n=1 Tax=Humibacillus sp. DSM 29435 TaxID=1869167 RepID=UPI000AE172C9|nr:lysylphosphatidylglycerol synthase transmembrane domain-containing protein [Humibacillus sp. DSM 29435]
MHRDGEVGDRHDGVSSNDLVEEVEATRRPVGPAVDTGQVSEENARAERLEAAAEVEVIEPPIPGRVRRPADAVRLAIVVLVLVAGLVVSDVAVDTRGAVEQDLVQASIGLPRLLLTLLGYLSGLGVLLLPIAVGADLLVRRRPLQLVAALGAAVVGGVLVIALSTVFDDGHWGHLSAILTRPTTTGRTEALDIVLVSMIGLLTVADITGRKWISPVASLIVVATVITSLLSGSTTLAAIVSSLLFGWVIGLSFRFGFGATSTRPPGGEVAGALVATGLALTRLELVESNHDGDRRYAGSTPSGPVEVQVIDRDTFGLASGRRLMRVLRLRNGFTRPPALTLRSELEHRTLMGLLLRQAGIPAPEPVSVCEVGPFSAALAFVQPVGTPVSKIGADLDAQQVAAIWRMGGELQRRHVAHRSLGPDAIIIDAQGRAGLLRIGAGDLAADDVTLRIDLAQLLTTVALLVGPDRAVSSAVEALGVDAVLRAVPLLQPVALTRSTREALKAKQNKGLLGKVRERLAALAPSTETPEPVELRRVTLRTVVTIVGGCVAGYFVLTQFTKVDFGEVISSASWGWAAGAVGFAVTTFAGASIALSGAVRIRLRFLHTFMTQLAVAFSGLVAPAAVGNIALNTRYLQTSGLPPAVAGASVGLAQVAQFCSYFVLLAASGVLAGTGAALSFRPPPILVTAIPVVVIVLLGLFAVPPIRVFITGRVVPQVKAAVPQVLGVFQRPAKLAQLLGGALLLDASFVGALVCATRAFGSEAPVAAVAVVYFAGAIIGSAVPTPGGLGGIEAALTYGLTTIGVDAATAFSSVLLYRLATYWLPIPFGWFSLNRLQKIGVI